MDESSVYPVLLVHGMDDSGARFNRMRAALLKRGFEPVFAMDIFPPDGSISLEAMGEQVQEAAGDLRRTTGAPKIDIVAYSMGSLAVRYFVQRLGGQSLVRRFISIAAPHHGTLMAYLRQNAGSRQMRPGSAFLRDLNVVPDGGGKEHRWGEMEVHSFWSPLDLMVVPASSSLLAQAHNRAFGVLFHPWMASDRRVIEAVVQVLAAPGRV